VDVGASIDQGGTDASGDGDVAVTDSSGDAGPTDPSRLRYTFDCPPGDSCGTAPAVHLSDLINFRPKHPVTSMEPNGWAVVNLDANFIARAAADVQTGPLLGATAQVRFTPGEFTWNYGDGESRTSADGGGTWAQLNVPEFSPTSTSHVYRQTGTFTVNASVRYSAEYRFGDQPWQAIAGSLEISADEFSVVVGDAKTVLVDEDCTTNPFGPGC
jgi:hypothetical protein